MTQLNRYYRRSRISEKKFREIIKYFALDLTANRTAVLTGLTHKTVNQIYLKIRHRLAQDCQRQSPFSGEVEVDESYFGARASKANAVAEQAVKPSSSVSTNAMAKSLPKLFRTSNEKRCKPLFAGVSASKQLFIPICGAVTTDWLIWVIRNISASIIQPMNLPMMNQISMASKVFGRMPNDDYKSSMELRKILSICT